MSIYLINLWYFVIVVPIVLLSLPLIAKLYKDEERNRIKIILSLATLLFVIRLILVFFGTTIGIMPYLVEDALFYSLLLGFGLLFTFYYLYKVENSNLKEIGFETENIKKSILFGIIGIIILMCITPLIIFLTDITLANPPIISPEKIIISLSFAILAAVYEEILFRGIIQNHLNKFIAKEWRIILYTAVIFTLTHVFYLPFTGFGIYYIFVFLMAFLLSWLRIKVDLIASAIVHGGIVFLLIINLPILSVLKPLGSVNVSLPFGSTNPPGTKNKLRLLVSFITPRNLPLSEKVVILACPHESLNLQSNSSLLNLFSSSICFR